LKFSFHLIKRFSLLLLTVISFSGIEIFSFESFCTYHEGALDKKWYGAISTGYAYSLNANITHPGPDWDVAFQGYGNRLGGSSFYSFSFGRSLFDYLKCDFSYTVYQGFHYQKFQTGFSDTPGFTGGARIRFFDLDHQSLLFNIGFYPENKLYFSIIGLDISPYLGVGLGLGFHRVYHFYTVANSSDVGSSTSIGEKQNSTSFAWQTGTGIRLHPKDSCISFDVGYRFYVGGRFCSSSNIYSNTPDFLGASDKSSKWRGVLKTNQITCSLNMDF
jgi:hypothetical protein